MKQRVHLKRSLVHCKREERHTNDADLHDAKQGGKQHLTKVKAKAGGDVEIGIDVMNVVETPEHRNFVVQHMPVVKTQIQQQKAKNELRPGRYGDEMYQAE